MTKELLKQADEIEIPQEIIELHKRKDEREKPLVRMLGDKIGYGRLMQLTEETWREKTEFKGSEFAIGACVSFMVPCDHSIKDAQGHCELCCGAGRVTKGVKALADEVRGKEEQARILEGLSRAYKSLCDQYDQKLLYKHSSSWYSKAQPPKEKSIKATNVTNGEITN